ncbi:hypothetical protein, partial [Pseudorhodoplanes sp.]|uniref:hypothetical protein n=1 Tax=Pseudorhodoplanes sp. TaxID=1934341 RepID=UPI00391BDF21
PAEGEADARPAFRIRMASLIERGEFEAELEGRYQAAAVPPFVMLDTAIAGVRALAGDEAEALVELLSSFHADREGAEAPGEAERQQLIAIEGILKTSWPAYRQLLEQNARWRNLMPLLAFQRFVDGWEGLTGLDGKPVEYARGKDGLVPEATLRRIHPALIAAAGNRAYAFQYAGAEEKN